MKEILVIQNLSEFSDEEIMKLLGERFHTYRLRLKKSQKAIAESSNVTRPTVSHFEVGSLGTTLLIFIKFLRSINSLEFLNEIFHGTPEEKMLSQLGENCRIRRLAMKKDLQDVAIQLSTKVTTIRDFENGSSISLHLFLEIQRFLGEKDIFGLGMIPLEDMLQKIGEDYRISRSRLKITRTDVSKATLINFRSVGIFENGGGIALSNFLRLLQVIDLTEMLSPYLPDEKYVPEKISDLTDEEIISMLGRKFRLCRSSLGKSQKNIADLLSLSMPTISRFENGLGPSLLVFIKLLKSVGKIESLNQFLYDKFKPIPYIC